MSNKDKICDLFYNKHKNQTEIAMEISVSQQYVSKVVKADSRYKIEKQERQDKNRQRRRLNQSQYIKNKREQEIREYEYLKYLQNCNSKEMSKRYLTNTPTLSSFEKAMYGISK